MRVLIVGSGGREHALAWKVSQSPRLSALYCAPGNPGMAALGTCVPIAVDQVKELTSFAKEHLIDLVIIGPEAPLALGLTDELIDAGIQAFGPTRRAAELESSKAFAKAFMNRHGIPTARHVTVTSLEQGLKALAELPGRVVIKASGLAAGKGVLLPRTREEAGENLRQLLEEKVFGAAGCEAVIEEYLEGEEISLLAFCDGHQLRIMPAAQDHKRLLDGDRGPNTGGMGAYAPAPACTTELAGRIAEQVLQPALDGMRAEGREYRGVLYAGMVLTASGPQTLEFNCRFGDPETQVILPLLRSDLLEVCLACASGDMGDLRLEWSGQSAACVVMASAGYPDHYQRGFAIEGLENQRSDQIAFQAGTKMEADGIVTAGGRVLAATAWAEDLRAALEKAYLLAGKIRFQGAQMRSDIGQRAINRLVLMNRSTYASAGVDIDAGNEAVRRMAPAVHSTYTRHVLAGIGSFGGLFDAAALKDCAEPVLVASTDGVGTKVKLASQLGRYHGLGQDIVNHCVNDILVQGARPLFFLDYFATSRLQPQITAEVVEGIAEACRENGAALLGGETAEMPGVYLEGEFDIAGTIVGVVDRSAILPRKDLRAGDVLVGLRSTGPHTNGFSLLRKIFADTDLRANQAELNGSLADALLAPHRSYFPLLQPVLKAHPQWIKAMAHLTGGGLIENIPRVLPEGLSARIHWDRWSVPPLFLMAQRMGNIDPLEMARVFNMGIGMVVILDPQHAGAFQEALGEECWEIGELVAGEKRVVMA